MQMINNRLEWIWLGVLVVVFIIQLLTLDVLPHLQQDEAQITEYGRLALHPETDWSINWRLQEGKPLLLWSYLGPLIAELSFHLGGATGLGPRIASIIGAILAATMAFGWLKSRDVNKYAAFGLSLAFLIDPLFVLSQRMGRVDSWVLAFCLGCCWLLRICLVKDKKVARRILPLCGGLAATAALVWPSALFLFPLILLELLQLAPSIAQGRKWKVLGEKMLLFGLGGVLTAFLLLLPIWQSVLLIFSDSTAMISGNIDASKSVESRVFSLFYTENWYKLMKALVKTWTPVLPILALAGILICRQKKVILSLLLAVTLIFGSLVYEFRVLYLLPYFILLSSGLFLQNIKSGHHGWIKKGSHSLLGILIGWSVFVSLGLRTSLGAEVKAEKDRNKIFNAASKSVGPGEYRVYLDFTYEFYFAGRALGWKLYTPYKQYYQDDHGNWLRRNEHQPEEEFLKLLSDMDYAFFYIHEMTPELEKKITASGLKYKEVIDLHSESKKTSPVTNRNEEILLYFLRGHEQYGPFFLYSRTGPHKDRTPQNFTNQEAIFPQPLHCML